MEDDCYLVLNKSGIRYLRKTRPDLKSGEIAVRLFVDVDDEYFERTIPEAFLDVDQAHLLEPEINVGLTTEDDV